MKSYAGMFLVLLLAACNPQPAPPSEMTSAERGQIQAEVLDWSDQWLAAGTRLDAQGVTDLFDQADAHFMNGGDYQANWQTMLDRATELYGGWQVWEASWSSRRVDVLASDAALIVGQAPGMIRDADGREFDVQAEASFVVRKKDGAWKGLYGQITGVWTPRN